MGTIKNGKKWVGAYVNGNIVSGLVKNGVVFYKKKVQGVYKRRIMVGDNLSYKTIYCDFPENYYQIISEEVGMGNQRQAIISDVKTTYIVENNLFPNFEVRVINGIQWQNNVYNYQNGNLITNLTSLSLENFGNVMTVNDNQAYRHIYIEDLNIRPIQVGDVITEDTKFYYIFPDDFYIKDNFEDRYIISLSNDTGFRICRQKIPDISDSLLITPMIKSIWSADNHVYRYNPDRSNFFINKSYQTNITTISLFEGNVYFTGTVTNVDTTDEVYKYILVDATTLG